MVLILVVVALVFAITTYQALFGMYSGLINVMCSLIAVAVALGFYEPVAELAGSYVPLTYAEPSILILLFVLTLGLLRGLADTKIRGNVIFPKPVDWIGGAVCGFFNAQLAVGVLAIAFFMLPLGPTRLGFSFYERLAPDNEGHVQFKRRSLSFLRPDEFTAKTFQILSGGSLSGSTALSAIYPDYMDWIAATANTPQVEANPTVIKADKKAYRGIQVAGYWKQEEPVSAFYLEEEPTYESKDRKYKDAEPYKPSDGKTLIGTRLLLAADSATVSGKEKLHNFRPTMIRLVGTQGDEPAQYFPRILAGVDSGNYGLPRVVNYDDNYGPDTGASVSVDAYFEVEPGFKPWFVEYRRRARAELGDLLEKAPEPLEPLKTRDQKKREDEVRKQGFVGTINRRGTQASDALPFTINPSFFKGNFELNRSILRYGRVSGYTDELQQSAGTMVNRFEVPKDSRLVQVQYSPYAAQSLPGQVFNYANQLVSYLAVDRDGKEYRLSGYFAQLKRDGRDYIELFYAGRKNPVADTYNASLKFQDIKHSDLTRAPSEAQLSLLFIVPAGTEITAIKTSAGKSVQLERESVRAK
jgi:hypothetical protein